MNFWNSYEVNILILHKRTLSASALTHFRTRMSKGDNSLLKEQLPRLEAERGVELARMPV